jgi:hypothetical protein
MVCQGREIPYALVLKAQRQIVSSYKGGLWATYDMVTVDIRENDSCYDNGVAKDGSYDPVRNQICLSPYHILHFEQGKKRVHPLLYSQAETVVMSVFLHEFSHMRGVDEIGACAVQGDYVINGNSHMNFQLLDDAIDRSKKSIGMMSDNLNDVLVTYKQNLPGASDDENIKLVGRDKFESTRLSLCTLVAWASASIKAISQVATTSPSEVSNAIVLPVIDILKLSSAANLASTAFAACLGGSALNNSQFDEKMFNGQPSVTLFDYMQKYGQQYQKTLAGPYLTADQQRRYSNIQVLRPQTQNLATIVSIVNAAFNIVEDISEEVIQLPTVEK